MAVSYTHLGDGGGKADKDGHPHLFGADFFAQVFGGAPHHQSGDEMCIRDSRYTLEREETVEETAYGPVRVKHAHGDGVEKSKPEYEDVAKIAREKGMTFAQASQLVK